MKTIFLTLSTTLVLSLSLAQAGGTETASVSEDAAAEADIEAGAALFKKDCRGCHGPTAKGVSSYPSLRDRTVEYLTEKLELYRSGEKVGPNTMLMAPRAKALSDEDIVNITHFIVSLEE